MHRPLALSVLLVLAADAAAQPEAAGCHWYRNRAAAQQRPLTAAERALIDETIARSDTFDILSYDISLDATRYAAQTIAASTAIRFAARMGGQQSIRFDLWDLTVDSVTDASGPMAFAYDGLYLRVQFPQPLPIGQEQQLTVHYHGHPRRDPNWGGFYFESGYIYNLGIGLTTIPPNFGKVWYPCFDSFVERASYTYRVKSAGGLRLHGQGELIEEVQLAGDTVLRTYALAQSIPTHLSAVAVADYQEHVYTHAGAFADIPVTLRAKATQLPAMVQGFADLGAAIDACEHWYGPYAYGRVGYALTTDGALEIPTNVAYPQHMTGQSAASNRKLYTHELGHHWWGDQVTPRVHNDMWLKEGPAEYSAHLLEEWLFGRTAMVNMVKNNLLSIMTSAHLNDGGFQALSPMPDPYIYGTHTYYKGAAVLHNLRGYMGDEAFRQGMHAAQVALAGTDITPEQLRDALEEATGVDLHPFFEDQVRHPGYSVFEVRSLAAQPSSGGYTVELHIGQKLYGTDHYHADVPLDLTLLAPHGQVHELRVMAGGPSTALQVQCPFAPEMAVLNRYHRLNQAHMETEVVLLPGEAFSNYPEWVDFALFANTLTDTTLVRFDHIWSGADQAPLGNGIVQVSGRHYWNVDGLWPEGTSLRGRVLYQGTAPTEFDYELIGGDETGMALVYRRTADEPWQVYPDQAVNAGSLTNGIGSITVDPLRKGQYAFAKVTGTIGIAEPAPEGFSLWPMPAADRVELRLAEPLEEQAIARLHDAMGRLVAEQALPAGIVRTAIEPLPETAGAYRLSIALRSGRLVGERPLMVVR